MVCRVCGKAFEGSHPNWDCISDEFKANYSEYEVEWIVECPYCGAKLSVLDTYRLSARMVTEAATLGYQNID